MNGVARLVAITGLVAGLAAGALLGQQADTPRPFEVGNPLGLPIVSTGDTTFEPMSSDVRVYGAVYSAESCSYDEGRGLVVVPNRGVRQNVQTNDGWVSLINHDGSVHTARWIGVQAPGARARLTPPLVLNEPYGSDVARGFLYVADRDGDTAQDDPGAAVIRWFSLETGAPAGEIRVEEVAWFNDIEVAADGTIYATQTGDLGGNPDPETWEVWRIAPSGEASRVLQGPPLSAPNGVALDADGNVVVVNMGDTAVLTFSPDGRLLTTEQTAQTGNDGIVIMPDGTKYVSSVRNGGISRIRPGQAAELIAQNIPNAASMCYDSGANQLVVPMNANSALAFVSLGPE
jgi:hypothetical protein